VIEIREFWWVFGLRSILSFSISASWSHSRVVCSGEFAKRAQTRDTPPPPETNSCQGCSARPPRTFPNLSCCCFAEAGTATAAASTSSGARVPTLCSGGNRMPAGEPTRPPKGLHAWEEGFIVEVPTWMITFVAVARRDAAAHPSQQPGGQVALVHHERACNRPSF